MGTTHFGVEVANLEDRWRALDSDESDVAAILLEDADLKLYQRRPTLPAAIASTDPLLHVDGRLAVMVVVDMVFRVMSNPDMFRTTTIGADGSIAAGYFGTEVLRPRVAIAAGDLDAIDAALRRTNQANPVVVSRILRNVDYGTPVTTTTLPTP